MSSWVKSDDGALVNLAMAQRIVILPPSASDTMMPTRTGFTVAAVFSDARHPNYPLHRSADSEDAERILEGIANQLLHGDPPTMRSATGKW